MVSYFTVQVEKNLKNSKCLYSIKYASNSRPYQIFVDRDRVGAITGKNISQCILKQMKQIDLAPEKIIFTAIQSNPRYIKDTVFQGLNHHVILFQWKQIPIRLFINQYTHLITGVEIIRYYTSNFNYVWGDTKRLALIFFLAPGKKWIALSFPVRLFVMGDISVPQQLILSNFDLPTSVDSLIITDSSFAKIGK